MASGWHFRPWRHISQTLDFGMQTYVVNRLNQCHAVDRMDEYTRVLHTGLLVNVLIPLAGFLLVLPIILMAPLTQWLQLKETDATTAAWVAVLLSFQMVYAIGYGMVFGVYRTINEYARGQMITNVRLLLNLIVTISVALLGGKLRAMAAAQLGLLVATSIFVYFDVSRRRPDVNIGLSQADWRARAQVSGTEFDVPGNSDHRRAQYSRQHAPDQRHVRRGGAGDLCKPEDTFQRNPAGGQRHSTRVVARIHGA